MTKGGRIAGGILAIVGGGIVVVEGFLMVWLLIGGEEVAAVIFTHWILGSIGLVGGVLLLVDKTAGGIIALIAGVGGTFLMFVPFIDPLHWLDTLIPFTDPVLILVGGLVGTIVGSES